MSIPMHIGFTGTRDGLTLPQRRALKTTLESIQQKVESSRHEILGHRGQVLFHHGDCVGADAQACELVRRIGWDIVCHPPLEDGLRAFIPSLVVHLPLPYLKRNRMIVDVSHRLVACPKGMYEEQRSGTWSTVRYASKQHKPIIIVWPGGRVTFEGEANG